MSVAAYIVPVMADGTICDMAYPLPRGAVMRIGRDARNKLVLKNGYVSKFHCDLMSNKAFGHLYIVDHSSNGTFVNKERCEKNVRQQIKMNDIITLGSLTFIIVDPTDIIETASGSRVNPETRSKLMKSVENLGKSAIQINEEKGLRYSVIEVGQQRKLQDELLAQDELEKDKFLRQQKKQAEAEVKAAMRASKRAEKEAAKEAAKALSPKPKKSPEAKVKVELPKVPKKVGIDASLLDQFRALALGSSEALQRINAEQAKYLNEEKNALEIPVGGETYGNAISYSNRVQAARLLQERLSEKQASLAELIKLEESLVRYIEIIDFLLVIEKTRVNAAQEDLEVYKAEPVSATIACTEEEANDVVNTSFEEVSYYVTQE